MKEKMKIGEYQLFKVEKNINETTLPLKEGELFWTVRLSKDVDFDCETQTEAEIISRLVKIENMLKKLSK